MPLTLMGDHPFARDEQGRLRSRIATVFPAARVLVTLPGIHATQRMAYLETVQAEYQREHGEQLTERQRDAVWSSAVDLIVADKTILIRPDPQNIPLMFEGDEVLQELVSKRQIHFLNVDHEKVRYAIKCRGECWRIAPLPKSFEEMKRLIQGAKIAISTRDIYYYNNRRGTRWLTCQEFAALANLQDDELRHYLLEIRQYCGMVNRLGNPEVAFFVAGESMAAAWSGLDAAAFAGEVLRVTYAQLRDRFLDLVPPELRQDDFQNAQWRREMLSALLAGRDDVVSEEQLLGLAAEFYMQLELLPGARIEHGEVIFDSVFEEPAPTEEGTGPPCDPKAKAFIYNFAREYPDLEYVNVGRVMQPLTQRAVRAARRGVYVVEMKQRGSDQEMVKLLRMQKWGVWERLDEGKPLLQAMIETEDYTDYVLDRRFACRQLGMRLPVRSVSRKIVEYYEGLQGGLRGTRIWSGYFERDYVRGIATDKIPLTRFENSNFALRFAGLLGRAAAPNIIVGRTIDGRVAFDDGDEVLLEDDQGYPADIVVTDHTGAFNDYLSGLEHLAREYAVPVNKRAERIADLAVFAKTYLAAFTTSFRHIQEEFRRHRNAFQAVFKDRPYDPAGSLHYRWRKVLERLDRSDPERLAAVIRQHIGGCPPG